MQDRLPANRSNAYSFQAPLGDATQSPIARRHLHDELLERLRDSIVTGELPPDSKIPEKELCERFGVSRTPLREALKVLAYEGLVVLHHNRGSTVSSLTLHDLNEAFPVYARLEAMAGEMAASRLSDAEIAEIRSLHDEMVELYRQRSRKRHFELNETIHERIQTGAGNLTLSNMLRSLSNRIRRARIYANIAEERWAEAVREHEAIIEALEARKGELLGQLLAVHMLNTFESFKQGLDHKAGGRDNNGAAAIPRS